MKSILSYGAGVNSTAIIALALLKEIPMPDYIIFSDTGAEWPHTYKYLNYIESKGIKIIYLVGGTKYMNLLEFCQMRNLIPSRMNRWCSDHWKIRPIEYLIRVIREEIGECKHYLGFDAGESHRAENKLSRSRNHDFPLIEFGLNRQGCKNIIRKAGLGIPHKSGCFICPYQNKAQWIKLKKEQPELWKIAVNLEKEQIKTNPLFTYRGGMTIDKFVADLDKQEELPFDFALDQKCECFFD